MTRRTLTAVLAAVALISPAAAQAQSQDLRSPDARDAARPTVAQPAPGQDLRSPDARDAARPTVGPRPIGQDLRSPDTRDIATRQAPPIAAPASQTVSHDDGSPVPVVPVVAGALLVLLAALIARYTVRRTSRGTRVAV